MDRKKALIAAASAALVVATSGAAIAANLSLLGDDGGDVGELDAESVTNLVDEPATTSTTVPAGQVIVVDEWVTDPAAPPAAPGTADPAPTGVDLSGDGLPDDDPTPGSSPDDRDGSYEDGDDDSYDDDSYEDHEDDEHEDEDHEDEHESEDDD